VEPIDRRRPTGEQHEQVRDGALDAHLGPRGWRDLRRLLTQLRAITDD
jgi:hypothetical protein